MERARAVMISHAAGPDGVPASLSARVATAQLRRGLGFSGAAFSDDLEMGRPRRVRRSARSVATRGARAGCDLLLVCRGIEEYPACVEAVERSVPLARREEATARLDAYGEHVESLRRAAAASEITLAAIRAELRSLA